MPFDFLKPKPVRFSANDAVRPSATKTVNEAGGEGGVRGWLRSTLGGKPPATGTDGDTPRSEQPKSSSRSLDQPLLSTSGVADAQDADATPAPTIAERAGSLFSRSREVAGTGLEVGKVVGGKALKATGLIASKLVSTGLPSTRATTGTKTIMVPSPDGALNEYGFPVMVEETIEFELWRTQVCDWTSSCWESCCEVLLCHPCNVSFQYSAVNDQNPLEMNPVPCIAVIVFNVMGLGLGTLMAAMHIRKGVKARYGIDEPPWEECIFGCCCTPCSLCQTQRELRLRGDEPTKACIVISRPPRPPVRRRPKRPAAKGSRSQTPNRAMPKPPVAAPPMGSFANRNRDDEDSPSTLHPALLSTRVGSGAIDRDERDERDSSLLLPRAPHSLPVSALKSARDSPAAAAAGAEDDSIPFPSTRRVLLPPELHTSLRRER